MSILFFGGLPVLALLAILVYLVRLGRPGKGWPRMLKEAQQFTLERDREITATALERAAKHCEESDVPVPVEEIVGTTKRQFSNVVIKHLAIELRALAAEERKGKQ